MVVPAVSQYMTHNPYAIGSREPLSDAHALMQAHHIHHLPVVDDGQLVGILSDEDVARGDRDDRTGDVMTRDVASVSASARLDEVVGLMSAGRFGSIVVTSERGVEGIFTLGDALRAFGEMLAG
jgi:acetoin utilization protein AcuB